MAMPVLWCRRSGFSDCAMEWDFAGCRSGEAAGSVPRRECLRDGMEACRVFGPEADVSGVRGLRRLQGAEFEVGQDGRGMWRSGANLLSAGFV